MQRGWRSSDWRSVWVVMAGISNIQVMRRVGRGGGRSLLRRVVEVWMVLVDVLVLLLLLLLLHGCCGGQCVELSQAELLLLVVRVAAQHARYATCRRLASRHWPAAAVRAICAAHGQLCELRNDVVCGWQQCAPWRFGSRDGKLGSVAV